MIQKWIIELLINQAIAWIARWLASNTPTQIKKDAKPVPIVRKKQAVKRVSMPELDTSTGRFRF